MLFIDKNLQFRSTRNSLLFLVFTLIGASLAQLIIYFLVVFNGFGGDDLIILVNYKNLLANIALLVCGILLYLIQNDKI